MNRRAAPVMPPDLPLSGSAPLIGPFSGTAFSGVTATAPDGTSPAAPSPSGAPGSASEPGRPLVVSSSAFAASSSCARFAASGEFSSAICLAASAAGSSFGCFGLLRGVGLRRLRRIRGRVRGRRGGGRGRSRRRRTRRGRRSAARAVGRGHSRHVLRARDSRHVRGGRQRSRPRSTRRAGASGSGAAGAAGAASPPPPPGMEIAGRSTRETTSATWLGNSFKPGRTVSENCQMPTPSIAAAIITPASEDLDSRMSSVWKALPPPRDISWASWSSPASRQAPAGSRRNRARKLGSASSRSISRAATSASVGEVAIAYLTPGTAARAACPVRTPQAGRTPARACP